MTAHQRQRWQGWLRARSTIVAMDTIFLFLDMRGFISSLLTRGLEMSRIGIYFCILEFLGLLWFYGQQREFLFE